MFRKYQHGTLTFSIWYAFTENFVLPISHDEVVHGKGSLLGKMAGDEWQRFANLRLLLGYMWTHPGKKLLFMGCDFGQVREWTHEQSLEWHVLQYPQHAGVQRWMRDLNHFYRDTPPLYELDFSAEGFQWIDCNNGDMSVLVFLRKGRHPDDCTLVACNFTPVPRENYQIGVPRGGRWRERLNSDARDYWGSGLGNFGATRGGPAALARSFSLTQSAPAAARDRDPHACLRVAPRHEQAPCCHREHHAAASTADAFPIKRTIGESVVVEADVFTDGHDAVAALLLYRHESSHDWHSLPMEPLGNDRWRAHFTVQVLGTLSVHGRRPGWIIWKPGAAGSPRSTRRARTSASSCAPVRLLAEQLAARVAGRRGATGARVGRRHHRCASAIWRRASHSPRAPVMRELE